MIEVTQTVLHDPDNGVNGNCFSAVLASLLHLPIEQVPLFVSPDWRKKLNAWLRPFGLAYIEIVSIDGDFPSLGIEGCYHEVSGLSPRFPDTLHSCVGHDGSVLFDPHPAKEAVARTTGHGFFIALEPWRWAEKLTAPTDRQSAISTSTLEIA